MRTNLGGVGFIAVGEKKENEAARLARALLLNAGLRPNPASALQRPDLVPPVARMSTVSAEAAFAGLSPVNRVESAQRLSRAARLKGTTEKELREELADFLSRQYGVPAVNLRALEIHPDPLALLPGDVAAAYGIIPVNVVGALLIVATHDPSNVDLLEAVARFTGFAVEPVVASLPDIDDAIARHYRG